MVFFFLLFRIGLPRWRPLNTEPSETEATGFKISSSRFYLVVRSLIGNGRDGGQPVEIGANATVAAEGRGGEGVAERGSRKAEGGRRKAEGRKVGSPVFSISAWITFKKRHVFSLLGFFLSSLSRSYEFHRL